MFRRVMVPLDGSGFAESALPAAIQLARRSGGEIRLVLVLEPVLSDLDLSPTDPSEHAAAAEYLASVRENKVSGLGDKVGMTVRPGLAAEEIAAEARDWKADVIVMATHGRSGVSRAWLGSVTDRCIRAANCPVLAVHPTESGVGPDLTTREVIVPLDESAHSEAALPYGVTLAQELGVPLHLVEVISLQRFVNPKHLSATMDRGAQAALYLRRHLDRLRRDGLDLRESVVVDPSVASAILNRAEGSLIVMSTHGRTGIDRAVFGSVADKVIRGATGSVLVIPARAS